MHHIRTKNVSNTTIYKNIQQDYHPVHHSIMKILYVVADCITISSSQLLRKRILHFYSVYTVRSIFLNNGTRAIYRPTQKLSTINQHQFTHRVSFVYLQLCTNYNLSRKVSFLYTSWMAEMNRELP
jgi:hypothetical protein